MANSSHDSVTAFAGERSFSASALMQLMPVSEDEEEKYEEEGDETQTTEEDCCLLPYCVRIDTVGHASQDKVSKGKEAWYDLAAGIAKAKRLMSKAVSDVESTLLGLVEQTRETVKSVEELPRRMTATLSREVDAAI
eukprot:2473704-Amphidinium_carterae.1